MVLSNKKLKQKLREAKTEQLTASETQINSTNQKNVKIPENPSGKTQDSIQSLLKTVTQKPRLSKREKRRVNLQSLPEKIKALRESDVGEVKKDGVDGVVEESKKRKRGEGEEKEGEESVEVKEGEKAKKKEKKKKRKREEGERKEGEDGVEVKEGEKAEKAEKAKKAKKKKKKQKKRKGKKKVEDGEVKEVVESGGEAKTEPGGAMAEPVVVETSKITESVVNPYEFTKVYAGGIPYYSTEDDIRSYFESCGTITEIDCKYFPETGKFRGIAIIAFKTEAAAKRALALDGSDMGGLYLKIQPYKSTRVNTPFVPAIVEGYNRIYVGNLSWDITEDDLRKLFSDCNITSIRFGEDKETKVFKGYGHVDFADSLSVNVALKLDQHIVCGRPIRISRAVPKKEAVTNENPTQQNDQVQVTTSVEAKTIQQDDQVYINEVKETQPTEPVISNEVSADVSSKIRRRTCYECGERGHLSSSCPNKQATDKVQVTTSVEAKSIQQDDQVYINEVKETQPIEPVISNEVSAAVSSKIRRRTCYECGQRGHLSSSCPNKKATDEANPVAS